MFKNMYAVSLNLEFSERIGEVKNGDNSIIIKLPDFNSYFPINDEEEDSKKLAILNRKISN